VKENGFVLLVANEVRLKKKNKEDGEDKKMVSSGLPVRQNLFFVHRFHYKLLILYFEIKTQTL
jgi:hypothetical protein